MQEDDDDEEAFLTIASPTSVNNVKIKSNNKGDLTFEYQRQLVINSEKSNFIKRKQI